MPPCASANLLLAAIPAFLSPAWALDFDSLDLFQYTLPLHMARAFPVDGPEAAPANPARLSRADHWYAQFGTGSAGRVSMTHSSAGVAVPGGISLGLAGLSVAGRASGTNAVFLEQRAAFQTAWKVPGMAAGSGLSIGYSLAWHSVNAWSVYKESATTHDIGFAWQPLPFGNGWRMDLGLALHDLNPLDAYIPDTSDFKRRYRLYSPNAEPLLRLDSPSGFVSAWISLLVTKSIEWDEYFGPHYSPGPGMGSPAVELSFYRYGMRIRPMKILELRLETPGYSVWQIGATVGVGGLLPWRLQADAAISKGNFNAYTRPSGSGYTLTWALRSGW